MKLEEWMRRSTLGLVMLTAADIVLFCLDLVREKRQNRRRLRWRSRTTP